MIPAFEKSLSTGAELHRIESSRRASVDNCVLFFNAQNSMGCNRLVLGDQSNHSM